MKGMKLFLFVVGFSLCAAQVYIDYGNPYSVGEFSVGITTFTPAGPGLNPPPVHTKAYYPESAGEFAVVYFVPGFAGTIPPELYDTLMELIASHGYVVFSVWVVVGDDGVVTTPEEHLRNIQWLRENTAGELGEATGSFDHLGFSCHSSGCGTILRIMNNDTDIGKAAVNIEPVSWVIGATDIYHSLPTINFGAEWANDCAIDEFDFLAFHEKSPCPKIMFEAQNATHCDLLTDEGWQILDASRLSKTEIQSIFYTLDTDGCHDNNICYTVDNSRLDEYRAFLQGFTAAFFTGYLQGNPEQLQYVTDSELMPWELLRHQVDAECL